MAAAISLLIIISLSIIITRIATVALSHTGLSKESAKFQARSAFTGVGFTTSEAEKVVNHPVRRKILMLLMLLGNAGIVSAISSLILTVVNFDRSENAYLQIVFLITGIGVLWVMGSSKWLDIHVSRLISFLLNRYTRLKVMDYEYLLNLSGDYSVSERQVDENDWLANRTLKDLKLRNEGVMVLGIVRKNGTYIGVPDGSSKILPDDDLILYGRDEVLEKICRRQKGISGNIDHEASVSRQKQVEKEEKKSDPGEQNSEKNN